MIKSPIIKYLAGFLPIISIGILLITRVTDKLDFANNREEFQTLSYTDLMLQGRSKIVRLPTVSEILSYEYTLDSGYLYPHCGVAIIPTPPKKYFEIANYDEIEIEITATKGKRISVQLSMFMDGMTNTDDMAPLRYLIYDLDLIDNKKRYLLPLSQFRTPTWWYSNNQITAERLPKSDFNKITSINFQNCQLIGLRQTDLVTIHNLSFKKDLWCNWAIYLVCIIIYYAVYFIVILKPQKPVIERKHKISFQEKLPVQSNSNKELEKLIKYLGENYQNSELSIPLVQKETGVSESKISILLKTEFGTTFKQYLTEIRLNEAKRLLKETDLQVAEIAYLVGFGNVSHFNRVFKTGTQLSPTNYREHNR